MTKRWSYRRGLHRLSKESLGAEYSLTLSTMNNLANLYVTFGRDQEALEIREQLYALTRKALDPDPYWDATGWMGNLAFSYFGAGRRGGGAAIVGGAAGAFTQDQWPRTPRHVERDGQPGEFVPC